MEQDVKLTKLTKCGGCGAKVGAGVLAKILGDIPVIQDENLIVGFDKSDDACVYRVNDEIAMVQTLDFFPPMVDDPYMFGQIAAANALSDIYAMGGKPKLALNLLAFPSNKLSPEHVGAILQGGADKVIEAGAVLCGGHTIEDKEPKYGLSVTGFVHPDRILENSSAKVGDLLILTKPLGSGILNTAAKADLLEEEHKRVLEKTMTTLNAKAAACMDGFDIHACTDVTGFGLGGHALEMASGSGNSVVLFTGELPILPETEEFARMGIIPAGAHRNRMQAEGRACFPSKTPLELIDIIFDPQTSGGLLISVAPGDAKALLERVCQVVPEARIIGEIRPRGEYELSGE